MSPRVIAMLYLKGETPTTISKFFINPASGRNISPGRISQILDEILPALRQSYSYYFES